ncbi:MAG: cyanophycin synthetase, partial [Pseudoxanthomonas sp.]
VAGKFDHYIVRRDDSLRGRDGDEVPRIIARALQSAGVEEAAISIIPDEQQSVEAALRMGEAGDLLLIFADALTRTWKQITKFQPQGEVAKASPRVELPSLETSEEEIPFAEMEGVIREERGLVFEREESD